MQKRRRSSLFSSGKNGVNPNLVAQVRDALEARELVKVTILQNCPEDKKQVAQKLSERSQSALVQVIGFTIILFKPAKEIQSTRCQSLRGFYGEKNRDIGRTFDPPHLAHLMIAQESMDACNLNEVWFIPTSIPPHKKNEDMASAEERVEMTRLAINNRDPFKLCTIELDREGPSYTLDTINILKRKYPNDEFYFIIGSDMAVSLHTWNGIEELKKSVTFIVTTRPNYTVGSPFEESLLR
ncbi:nicotinate (nicotinamide) nucleotide adenylyltransferase [Salicibibacter halophilus]|uniref:nicotinate (nicotinamide) nucleotide adenylyltransferase n=1 Tax=Salicibibacter halophilus TaxID=2502791 RepID=UPI001D03D4B8|nr:nicotinate (nicotinamide) nucleotide adenylyltransferase [Salicibibacter halophilus]